MTTDAAGAGGFYTEVTGWGTERWDGSATPYVMWTANGEALGGVTSIAPEMSSAGTSPHWLTYISTPNVEETVERATALGATVRVPPASIPTIGRYAILDDPQGATFALFTPEGEAPEHDTPARVGEFGWHELATSDLDGAIAFYTTLFGWDESGEFDLGEGRMYRMFGRNGVQWLGIYVALTEPPTPPHWLPYARVADIESAAKRVTELGGTILWGPMEVPGGDFVLTALDAQGATFALHEVRG